jgi:hypothetical protein
MIFTQRRSILLLLGIALTLIVSTCKIKNPDASLQEAVTTSAERCVALRGNGTHIVAHVMGLARLLPEWGEIHGFAGGSSATITTFLYESMSLNPAVKALDGKPKASALALLMKSTIGYATQVAAEPEWKALLSFQSLAARLQEKGIFDLAQTDHKKLASDLRAILGSDEFRDLVNPEVLRMLQPLSANDQNFARNVKEVQKAAVSLVNLDAEDSDVFFRPGIVNFSKFVELIGRVADFYAGYGRKQADMASFLNDCSAGTDDRLWSELSTKATAKGTCGERFTAIIKDWRANRSEKSTHRVDDLPGLATKSITITSVVKEPSAMKKLQDYETLYKASKPRRMDFNFEDVRFGYWISRGLKQDLVESWTRSSDDWKAKKAINLGSNSTWRQILEKSPQEPSLGKYTSFESNEHLAGALSLGGWADLHPVQILKAAGCQDVIYLTRRTDETVFISKGPPFEGRKASGLAEILGMDKAGFEAIYSLDNPRSAFSSALRAADGVWCTDWNKFSAFEQTGIAMDAWNSPLITEDARLPALSASTPPTVKIRGCQ